MIAKRALDVLMSLISLMIFGPIMVVTALVILLFDGKPVIFRQERVGRHGEVFEIHKFRTMKPQTSSLRLSTTNDSRLTKTGALLRKWKIDELPQLYDVVRGKMSLVGPRPEVPEYVDRWPASSKGVILSVRPGITDPASVRFRNEQDILAQAENKEKFYVEQILPEKVSMYVSYVGSISLYGDLKILISTVKAVFAPKRDRNR